MTVKTDVSRFHIHDELTAPDGSAPLIKSIQTAGGAVSKFIGVLPGSPAPLRGYTRVRPGPASSNPPRAARPNSRDARSLGAAPPPSGRGGPRGRLERRGDPRRGRRDGAGRVREPV